MAMHENAMTFGEELKLRLVWAVSIRHYNQQKIAGQLSKAHVGRTVRAIVDTPLVARGVADAPDIDGRILLSQPAPVGEFINVHITGTQVYDLLGTPLPA